MIVPTVHLTSVFSDKVLYLYLGEINDFREHYIDPTKWMSSLGSNSMHDKLGTLLLHLYFSTSFFKIQIQL